MRTAILSTDRRSVRTRKELASALAQEITASGDLSRVTVSALAENAGLTRRTFYSHFKDIAALTDFVETETLCELKTLLTCIFSTHLDELKAALLACEPAPKTTELLRYIYERGALFSALLGEGGDPAFAERIADLVREVLLSRALHGIDAHALGPFFDYYLTFGISAELGVVKRWLAGGMQESPETMARLMSALLFVRPGDLYSNPIDVDVLGLIYREDV